MFICSICKKKFEKHNGFKNHFNSHQRKIDYFNNPKICKNPLCNNVIPYKLKKQQIYCCRKCQYTKERRNLISKTTKLNLEAHPERYKKFGVTNRVTIKYKTKKNNMVILQSSYELKVAKELDSNNIEWVRPAYMNYIDSKNKYRKYYPDFYLKDYDVYLDPKNDWLIKNDTEKIRRCQKQNNVIIIILCENELCWKSIQNKILSYRL